MEKQCSVEGCKSQTRLVRGMCLKHYDRWRYHNNIHNRKVNLTVQARSPEAMERKRKALRLLKERDPEAYRARRDYHKNWCKANPDKIAKYKERKKKPSPKCTYEWIAYRPEAKSVMLVVVSKTPTVMLDVYVYGVPGSLFQVRRDELLFTGFTKQQLDSDARLRKTYGVTL